MIGKTVCRTCEQSTVWDDTENLSPWLSSFASKCARVLYSYISTLTRSQQWASQPHARQRNAWNHV